MPKKSIEDTLREYAMSFPETVEEFPWGHSAFKVKGKSFVFMSNDKGVLTMSVKLPQSRDMALDLDFTEPTHYGMGKYGWVTATVGKSVPAALLKDWIRESYKAIAPKKLAAQV